MSRLAAAALLALTVPAAALAAAQPAKAPAAQPVPMLGVSWYPEHWPEERWEADLALMQRGGIRFVRIGEFAWSRMEPREGVYDLDWLERAVRAAQRHGIAVVIGTPTAGPPAWLTSRYPEVLRTLPDGTRAAHGGRHQASYNSARFNQIARDLVAKLADRFGHDPNVIGWQIDNEIGTGDFGPETRTAFQAWLKAKWKTLDALNADWSTAYWSQTYQDWSQIPLPLPRAEGNPGLMLAFRQFDSDGYRAYLAYQLDVLRAKVDKRQRVTTNYWIDARAKTPANFSADADDMDLDTVTQDLDFAAWDEYIGTGHFDAKRFGMTHDLVRGLLRRPFWVMETQPGTVNWSDNNNALDPGEVRAVAWNAVGHGADALAYWQWRSPINGQEQYHGTLLGADGTPVPVYDEVARIGAEFSKAAPVLAGTTVVSDVALLNDFPSRWAIAWQRYARDYLPADAAFAWYRPMLDHARSVDIVADTAPLASYRLVVAPALNVLTPETAQRLTAYVESGGNLVLGARSGMKDGANALWPQRQPGPLAALLGARVVQYYALERPVPVEGDWGKGQATTWGERLETTAPDAEVVLRYGAGNGWLEGQPAAVTRLVGKGSITYVGATLDDPLMTALTARLMSQAKVDAVWPALPADVDMAVRSGKGRRVVILTNYGAGNQRIDLPAPMRDVLSGGTARAVDLPRYGVTVLESTP